MNKKGWAILLFALSFISWFFPQWNGLVLGPSFDVTRGDGHIVAAIFLVGGLLLWYLPNKLSKD